MTREQRIAALIAEITDAEQRYGLRLTVKAWLEPEMLGNVLQARPRVKWDYADIPGWIEPEEPRGEVG